MANRLLLNHGNKWLVALPVLLIVSGCFRKSGESLPKEGGSLKRPGMVWIPDGTYIMGTEVQTGTENALPPRPVQVSGFWMDETEVTNDQFAKFIEATGYVTLAEKKVDWEELKKQVPVGTAKPPDEMLQPGSLVFSPPGKPVMLNDYSQWWHWVTGANWRHPQGPNSSIENKGNYPVVQIAFDDAQAYAKWAGKRLPTEAEYELAARGGINKTYAWGDELNPQGRFLANYFQGSFPNQDTGDDGFKGLAPVRSFPANPFGLYDMVGNVWELCTDWYSKEPCTLAGVQVNPTGPQSTKNPDDPYAVQHVSKGGSFLCSVQYCSNYRPTGRQATAYDTGMDHVGFRCVVSASKEGEE